jgi:hypothetical protein
MLRKKSTAWMAIATLSASLLWGCELSSWMTKFSTAQATQGREEAVLDKRLARLEQAVTALTHAVEHGSAKSAQPEMACAASQTSEGVSQQALAHIIREELRQALVNGTPESQRARAEEIAIAQALNSPENRAAYQSASDVVRVALAAGRWTDEDGRIFRDAFPQLTNDQRMEVMQTLAPAINRGEITVETSGPLF